MHVPHPAGHGHCHALPHHLPPADNGRTSATNAPTLQPSQLVAPPTYPAAAFASAFIPLLRSFLPPLSIPLRSPSPTVPSCLLLLPVLPPPCSHLHTLLTLRQLVPVPRTGLLNHPQGKHLRQRALNTSSRMRCRLPTRSAHSPGTPVHSSTRTRTRRSSTFSRPRIG